MTKEHVIRRGQAAARVLADETALKAFEAVIADLQSEWLRTRPDDTAAREGCYRMVHAVQLVVAKLEAWRANAMIEESGTAARSGTTKVPEGHDRLCQEFA